MNKILNLFLTATLLLVSASVTWAQTEARSGLHINSLVDKYVAKLSGAQEVTDPAGGVDTDLGGRIFAYFNSTYSKLNVIVRLRPNSKQTITAMHFHCGRAGQNGPLAMGLIAPGSLSLVNNQVRGSLSNADVIGTGCEDIIGRPINNLVSLAQAMTDGLIYLNVHSIDFPAGVVRGQLRSVR